MEKIKELRDMTGAGIVDCKKALEEADGDIEKAVELLRKKGIAKAAKRSDREASEGLIKVGHSDDGSEGYMVEVNAETDFVVRSERFQNAVEKIFNIIKEKKPADAAELDSLILDGQTVKETIDILAGVIGEKIGIKRFAVISSDGTIASYSHMEGRIGVLVELDKPGQSDLARNIAMQVAASNPACIYPEQVEAAALEKEKEIYREQLIKEGKPEAMIDKILEGKVAKYYDEVCLIKQEYIKDDKKKVQDILGDVKALQFVRFSL